MHTYIYYRDELQIMKIHLNIKMYINFIKLFITNFNPKIKWDELIIKRNHPMTHPSSINRVL